MRVSKQEKAAMILSDISDLLKDVVLKTSQLDHVLGFDEKDVMYKGKHYALLSKRFYAKIKAVK